MSQDDVKELYPERAAPAVPGLKQFEEIASRANKFYKHPESELYIQNFSVMALRLIGPYPDKFRRALDWCVNNYPSFPAVLQLKEALEKLPRRPVDHLATPVQFVSPGCDTCRHKGLVKMISPDANEYYAYCMCELGHKLRSIGSQGVRTRAECEHLGFKVFKRKT